MNKKDIDKLFQEKLRDYREVPDDSVWNSIEESLDKKKKSRRVIPIWWKLGGAAAVLLIALLIINPFASDEIPNTNISDTEELQKTNPSTDTDNNLNPERERIVPDASQIPPDASGESMITATEDKDSKKDQIDSEEEQQFADPALTDKALKQTEVAETKPKTGLEESAEKDALLNEEAVSVNRENAMAVNEDVKNESEQLKENLQNPDADLRDRQDLNELERSVSEETAVAEQIQEEKPLDQSEKKSIFDEIRKQEEEELLVENSGPKWSVGPSIAPVYFNSLGEGSPIHSNFVSNSKSGNVNLSYGVAVAYEITDKLKLRSGLHKVDYGYDTNDITFSSSLVASTNTQITNITYTSTSRNLVVESSSGARESQEFAANDIIAQSPSRSGRMVQEFGYLEVPMELNYALLDRKFNVNIIGGISSLFLVNNSVTLESDGTSTEMGDANNLNDINFSTNVGIGVNYELTDKMNIHLEPMFKYQLNTFSDTEGNFQPYSLGVYTGMSFKF